MHNDQRNVHNIMAQKNELAIKKNYFVPPSIKTVDLNIRRRFYSMTR